MPWIRNTAWPDILTQIRAVTGFWGVVDGTVTIGLNAAPQMGCTQSTARVVGRITESRRRVRKAQRQIELISGLLRRWPIHALLTDFQL